ncbi:MAG: helix-turn-helix transcriptional regulator, partial [Conexibacter sp.]
VVEFVSPVAQRLLGEHFPGWSARGGRLPVPLAEALAARARHDGSPLLVPGPPGPLVARLVAGRLADEPDALLLTAQGDPLELDAVLALGLTRRQAEVLRLVALGRSTEGVAQQLRISPATVRKHLEHVYDRLGVTSRTAAVATAWAGAEVAEGAATED